MNLDEFDFTWLTAYEIQRIQTAIIEKWDDAKLKSEYLTKDDIAIRIRNNKAVSGQYDW
jgi:hypothetical protein